MKKQEWTHEPIPPLTKKHQRRNFFSKSETTTLDEAEDEEKNWRFDSSEAGITGKPRVTNWSQPHGTHGPNSCRRIFSYSSFNSADLRSGASREEGLRSNFIYISCAIAFLIVSFVIFAQRATYNRLVRVAETTILELRVRVFRHLHRLSLADHQEARKRDSYSTSNKRH